MSLLPCNGKISCAAILYCFYCIPIHTFIRIVNILKLHYEFQKKMHWYSNLLSYGNVQSWDIKFVDLSILKGSSDSFHPTDFFTPLQNVCLMFSKDWVELRIVGRPLQSIGIMKRVMMIWWKLVKTTATYWIWTSISEK